MNQCLQMQQVCITTLSADMRNEGAHILVRTLFEQDAIHKSASTIE